MVAIDTGYKVENALWSTLTFITLIYLCVEAKRYYYLTKHQAASRMLKLRMLMQGFSGLTVLCYVVVSVDGKSVFGLVSLGANVLFKNVATAFTYCACYMGILIFLDTMVATNLRGASRQKRPSDKLLKPLFIVLSVFVLTVGALDVTGWALNRVWPFGIALIIFVSLSLFAAIFVSFTIGSIRKHLTTHLTSVAATKAPPKGSQSPSRSQSVSMSFFRRKEKEEKDKEASPVTSAAPSGHSTRTNSKGKNQSLEKALTKLSRTRFAIVGVLAAASVYQILGAKAFLQDGFDEPMEVFEPDDWKPNYIYNGIVQFIAIWVCIWYAKIGRSQHQRNTTTFSGTSHSKNNSNNNRNRGVLSVRGSRSRAAGVAPIRLSAPASPIRSAPGSNAASPGRGLPGHETFVVVEDGEEEQNEDDDGDDVEQQRVSLHEEEQETTPVNSPVPLDPNSSSKEPLVPEGGHDRSKSLECAL